MNQIPKGFENIDRTIQLVLQKLIAKDIEYKLSRDSHINQVEYIFEEDKENIDSIDKGELSRVLVNYKSLEANSQDTLFEVIWDYDEFPGLERNLVEHKLPILRVQISEATTSKDDPRGHYKIQRRN